MFPRGDDADEKGEKPRRLTKRQQTVLQDFVEILLGADAKNADEICTWWSLERPYQS